MFWGICIETCSLNPAIELTDFSHFHQACSKHDLKNIRSHFVRSEYKPFLVLILDHTIPYRNYSLRLNINRGYTITQLNIILDCTQDRLFAPGAIILCRPKHFHRPPLEQAFNVTSWASVGDFNIPMFMHFLWAHLIHQLKVIQRTYLYAES